MSQDFRMTAVFKPLLQKPIPINSHQMIELEKIDPEVLPESVSWRRINDEMIEDLERNSGSNSYQCTCLDWGCLIEAYYHTQSSLNTSDIKTLKFGPVAIQDQNFLDSLPNNFQAKVVLPDDRSEKCLLEFGFNQILLKSASNNLQLFVINIGDIKSCYVEKKVLIFPTVFQRVVCLKVFREIISHGHNYSNNNHPLKLTIDQVKDFDQLLLKISSTKLEFWRRTSQVNNLPYQKLLENSFEKQQEKFNDKFHEKIYDKRQKNSNLSTDILRKSNIKQQSESSFKNPSSKSRKAQDEGMKRNLMKNSQLIIKKPKQSDLIPSESEGAMSLQGDKNYLNDFENLLFDPHAPEPETLALNDSFEELEKKPNSIQEKFFFSHTRRIDDTNNPVLKKLYLQLQDAEKNHVTLVKINKSLKKSVQTLTLQKGNCNSEVQSYFQELQCLKQEYSQLVREVESLKRHHQSEQA